MDAVNLLVQMQATGSTRFNETVTVTSASFVKLQRQDGEY